jgi:hypothetical protein
MKWIGLLLILIPNLLWASIGTVTEHSGTPAELVREKNTLEANKGTGIEMNDAISTNKTRLAITFDDNTKVQLTEQSRLVIDDFVYDPNQGTGKMAMNVAMGTVRMASGSITKNSRENVSITTPTATISVRGTDFTMTVDEVGRSLIILLPTCPDPTKPDECWAGSIEVSTDAGYVLLNQAYQATMVSSANSVPTEPKIVNVEESFIDNMLIVSPPKALFNDIDKKTESNNDHNLDQDFLEYQDLSKNYLEEQLLKQSELDINRLDQDYLSDVFLIDSELDEQQLDSDSVLPNIRNYPQIQNFYNEEIIYLLSDRPPHIAQITTSIDSHGIVNIVQDGISAGIQLNDGGSNVIINIIQNQ